MLFFPRVVPVAKGWRRRAQNLQALSASEAARIVARAAPRACGARSLILARGVPSSRSSSSSSSSRSSRSSSPFFRFLQCGVKKKPALRDLSPSLSGRRLCGSLCRWASRACTVSRRTGARRSATAAPTPRSRRRPAKSTLLGSIGEDFLWIIIVHSAPFRTLFLDDDCVCVCVSLSLRKRDFILKSAVGSCWKARLYGGSLFQAGGGLEPAPRVGGRDVDKRRESGLARLRRSKTRANRHCGWNAHSYFPNERRRVRAGSRGGGDWRILPWVFESWVALSSVRSETCGVCLWKAYTVDLCSRECVGTLDRV